MIGSLLMLFKKYRHVGFAVFVAQGINGVAVQILKDLIARPRPFVVQHKKPPCIGLNRISAL